MFDRLRQLESDKVREWPGFSGSLNETMGGWLWWDFRKFQPPHYDCELVYDKQLQQTLVNLPSDKQYWFTETFSLCAQLSVLSVFHVLTAGHWSNLCHTTWMRTMLRQHRRRRFENLWSESRLCTGATGCERLYGSQRGCVHRRWVNHLGSPSASDSGLPLEGSESLWRLAGQDGRHASAAGGLATEHFPAQPRSHGYQSGDVLTGGLLGGMDDRPASGTIHGRSRVDDLAFKLRAPEQSNLQLHQVSAVGASSWSGRAILKLGCYHFLLLEMPWRIWLGSGWWWQSVRAFFMGMNHHWPSLTIISHSKQLWFSSC